MSIIYISKSKWQRNIVKRCATQTHNLLFEEKKKKNKFSEPFQFFPPLSFPRFFFSIYYKLKIVPKKVITVVKSLHITIRLYRRTSLCASRTTTRTNMYSKVPRSTILWTHSHLLGGFAAKAANFLPNSCKVLGRAKRAKELFPCNYNHIVCSDTSLKLTIKYFGREGSHRHDEHQWRLKLEKICVS